MNTKSISRLIKMTVTMSVLALSAPSLAQAREGGIHGGGGKGVLCTSKDGQFRSLEVLDLYESRILYKRPPVFDQRPMLEQARDAKDRLDKAFPPGKRSFIKSPDAIMKQIVFIRDAELKDTEDSNHIITPRGCSVVQLANYSPEGHIFIDQTLWEKMDELNRAALLVHEAVYKAFRARYGDQDSLRARRAVGYVFSGKSFQPPVIPPNSYQCAESNAAIIEDDWPRPKDKWGIDSLSFGDVSEDDFEKPSEAEPGFFLSFGKSGATLDFAWLTFGKRPFGRSAITAALPHKSLEDLAKDAGRLRTTYFFRNIESPVDAHEWVSYTVDGVSNGVLKTKSGENKKVRLLHMRLDYKSVDGEDEPVEEYVCWPSLPAASSSAR